MNFGRLFKGWKYRKEAISRLFGADSSPKIISREIQIDADNKVTVYRDATEDCLQALFTPVDKNACPIIRIDSELNIHVNNAFLLELTKKEQAALIVQELYHIEMLTNATEEELKEYENQLKYRKVKNTFGVEISYELKADDYVKSIGLGNDLKSALQKSKSLGGRIPSSRVSRLSE
jgi:hypothetical protein